jgi:mannose-6-phosphate isomerase-like protein (cupin superfamily)
MHKLQIKQLWEGIDMYDDRYRMTEKYPYPVYPTIYDYEAYYDYWKNTYAETDESAYYHHRIPIKDYGKQPFVVNIEEATKQNRTFRTALWTGKHLQVVLMSIQPGEAIGLEVHPTVDQFLRLEKGRGLVQMGKTKDQLTFQREVYRNDAIMVPAGIWHNITNIGNKPLKLYTIYAPPEHPFGTVEKTKPR